MFAPGSQPWGSVPKTRRSSLMTCRWPWRVLVCTLVVTLLCPMLLNAEVTGTVSGTVSDPSGAAVGDANVTLQNSDTGLVRRLKTGTNGRYEFLSIPVGENYSVQVQAVGFRTATQTGIKLDVNQ